MNGPHPSSITSNIFPNIPTFVRTTKQEYFYKGMVIEFLGKVRSEEVREDNSSFCSVLSVLLYVPPNQVSFLEEDSKSSSYRNCLCRTAAVILPYFPWSVAAVVSDIRPPPPTDKEENIFRNYCSYLFQNVHISGRGSKRG